MSDQETRVGSEELQFDHVVSESKPGSPPSKLAVVCAACQTPIETEYYDVNGNTCCGRCRLAAESAAETPEGIIPLLTAGAFGLGAGIVGAAIYYAVIAIAHLEIGIVAVLIGYMVGYAVRKGARERGGFRFQVLAVALTYASVAFAYTPMAFQQMIAASGNAQRAQTTGASGQAVEAAGSRRTVTTRPSGAEFLIGLASLLAFIAVLPMLVVFGSLPYGLISAFIIFIGMRQAWGMTRAPWVQVLGPYRVGAAAASTPA
jgi:hypothetical protein